MHLSSKRLLSLPIALGIALVGLAGAAQAQNPFQAITNAIGKAKQQLQQQGQTQGQPTQTSAQTSQSQPTSGSGSAAPADAQSAAQLDATSATADVAVEPNGGPDVLGIRLGMPRDEALEILKKAVPGQKLETQTENLPTVNKQVLVMFGYGFAPETSIDDLRVYLTPGPGPQMVYRVQRYLGMQKIFHANVLSSLHEKYGSETVHGSHGGDQLYWMYDEQGKPGGRLPSTAGSPELQLENCAASAPDSGSPDGLTDSWLTNYQRNPSWCDSSGIIVRASFGTQDIVTSLRVDMFDIPLSVRATKSKLNWLSGVANSQRQQQVEESKQNRPTL